MQKNHFIFIHKILNPTIKKKINLLKKKKIQKRTF